MLMYIFALFVVGVPMLILELTLGQKMQRGSGLALRGVLPKLGGVGWAASWAGFVTALVYNVMMGISLYYLFAAGSMNWVEEKLNRPISCQTAEKAPTPAAELYFNMNVTKFFGEKSCDIFQEGLEESRFAGGLFVCVLIIWALVFLSLFKGPRAISYITAVTATIPFLFLFVLMGYYINLNSSVEGKGMDFYFGNEKFAKPGQTEPDEVSYPTLLKDSYNQVFFSLSLCTGVMFAYGSYNHIKQPIIMDSFIIAILDFVFALLAGTLGFSVIGYLEAKDHPAHYQTSSAGLTFIAFPTVASLEEGGKGWFILFCLFLFFAGIDSALAFVEALVTNVIDYFKCRREIATGAVCLLGVILSSLLTTNFGWILFDMSEHYISDYLITGIGFAECVSVGWVFEYYSTGALSPSHHRALRALHYAYWIPIVTLCFYAQIAEVRMLFMILMIVFPLIALCISKYVSGMKFNIWYHDIMLCGVDKLSMSITSLTHENPFRRSWWMPIFEIYFGLTIKYINPPIFLYIIINNLFADLSEPYAGQSMQMQMFSTIFLFISLLVIVFAFFTCGNP